MKGLVRKDTVVRDGGFKLLQGWCSGEICSLCVNG